MEKGILGRPLQSELEAKRDEFKEEVKFEFILVEI